MSERHRHRKDANDDEITDAAERCGWLVMDTSQTGLGFDKLLVKAGRIVIAEVKDGMQPMSAQRLTPHEQQVHQRLTAHGVTVEILTCADDVLMLERPQPHRRDG